MASHLQSRPLCGLPTRDFTRYDPARNHKPDLLPRFCRNHRHDLHISCRSVRPVREGALHDSRRIGFGTTFYGRSASGDGTTIHVPLLLGVCRPAHGIGFRAFERQPRKLHHDRWFGIWHHGTDRRHRERFRYTRRGIDPARTYCRIVGTTSPFPWGLGPLVRHTHEHGLPVQ